MLKHVLVGTTHKFSMEVNVLFSLHFYLCVITRVVRMVIWEEIRPNTNHQVVDIAFIVIITAQGPVVSVMQDTVVLLARQSVIYSATAVTNQLHLTVPPVHQDISLHQVANLHVILIASHVRTVPRAHHAKTPTMHCLIAFHSVFLVFAKEKLLENVILLVDQGILTVKRAKNG